MELLARVGLCVLLFLQVVSARMFKREVTVECNNFSSILMQDTKFCIYEHDNIRPESGLILETSQLENIISSRCSALLEIRNCVREKYGSCPNIDDILEAVVDDELCTGDQPYEGITYWFQSHQLDHVNDNCAGEIDTCMIQVQILEYMVTKFENLKLNESSPFLWEYSTRVDECVNPLFGEGAICGDMWKYVFVKMMIDIQITTMPLQILGDMMAE